MSESNTMRVYVKNTAKSEELFNHVFGKLSGKTLSTYLAEQYMVIGAHLPMPIMSIVTGVDNLVVTVDNDDVDRSLDNSFVLKNTAYLGTPKLQDGCITHQYIMGLKLKAKGLKKGVKIPRKQNIVSITVYDSVLMLMQHTDEGSPRDYDVVIFDDFLPVNFGISRRMQ